MIFYRSKYYNADPGYGFPRYESADGRILIYRIKSPLGGMVWKAWDEKKNDYLAITDTLFELKEKIREGVTIKRKGKWNE